MRGRRRTGTFMEQCSVHSLLHTVEPFRFPLVLYDVGRVLTMPCLCQSRLNTSCFFDAYCWATLAERDGTGGCKECQTWLKKSKAGVVTLTQLRVLGTWERTRIMSMGSTRHESHRVSRRAVSSGWWLLSDFPFLQRACEFHACPKIITRRGRVMASLPIIAPESH